ncbi:pyridoxal phosphate-dependent transferase [Lactarius pseudohatsudake]|nr:pyridoxal phosphate-dependent transferase [Lactarius pseudohatsudake]
MKMIPGAQASRANTPLHFRDVDLDVSKSYKHEDESEAHQLYRQSAGHKVKGTILPQTVNPVGSTGVIYCSDRAQANGFNYASSHEWSNLGQGAPEVGPIPGAPNRPLKVEYDNDALEYAPTTGVKALREAVANLYNTTYRQGKASQYTYENVCIVPGGRAGLSRVAAVIGDVYCSYQVPDYTAYDQMLSAFRRLVPVPTSTKDIHTQGLAVIIASNPRNPTGQSLSAGKDLKELVDISRESTTTIILDEFYSWYIYHDDDKDIGKSISSAEYVEDVNQDSNLITALSQSGSFLDGGANHPLQLAAVPLLDPQHVHSERIALQKHFKMKRDHVLKRLKAIGVEVTLPPVATFYIWLNLENLPDPINNGLTFFEELLKEKTIVIPGIFFDINPAHRRNLFNSPCHHFVRLSFGPPLEDLDKGIDAIARVLRKAKKEGMRSFGHSYRRSIDGPASLTSHV